MHPCLSLYLSISPTSLWKGYPQLEEKNEADNKSAHIEHTAEHAIAIKPADQEKVPAADQQQALSPKLNLLIKSAPLAALCLQIASMSAEHRIEFVLQHLPVYFFASSIAVTLLLAKIG